MSLKAKLLCLVLFALGCISGIIYYSNQSMNQISKTVGFFGNERLPLTSHLGDIRAASNGIPRFMWLALAQPIKSPEREKSLKRVEAYLKEISTTLVEMEKFQLLPESKVVLAEMKTLVPKLDEVLLPCIGELRDGSDEGDKLAKVHLLTKMPPVAVKLTDSSIALAKLVAARNQAVLVETEKNADTSSRNLLIFSSVAAGIFGVIGLFFALSLSKKLTDLSQSIGESSNQVASAAGTIASASEILSQATSEQAASLEQTAASIEEMSSMVNKNSDNAKNAADTSVESQKKAERGNQVIERMISSMDEISKSNNEIAEIVKVIKEIGNKTKVINDIVFQTKLLSFNASVEAARAGEHGKGFAVVAEEVGNLAQMSGNASKEIADLLDGSILKVESIVNETKMKVDIGSKVARECGEVLGEIVVNVGSVSQMAGEISTASQEQSQGIQEITKAMTQLDQVTQQNAATSEEAANEAEELSAQANSLKVAAGTLFSIVSGRVSDNKFETHNGNQKGTQNKLPESKIKPKKDGTIHVKVSEAFEELDVPAASHSGFKDV